MHPVPGRGLEAQGGSVRHALYRVRAQAEEKDGGVGCREDGLWCQCSQGGPYGVTVLPTWSRGVWRRRTSKLCHETGTKHNEQCGGSKYLCVGQLADFLVKRANQQPPTSSDTSNAQDRLDGRNAERLAAVAAQRRAARRVVRHSQQHTAKPRVVPQAQGTRTQHQRQQSWRCESRQLRSATSAAAACERGDVPWQSCPFHQTRQTRLVQAEG